MLTIRWVGLNGNELVQEVGSVDFVTPEHARTSNTKCVVCHFETEAVGILTIDTGTVYVMNRYGKTVAVYNLGNPYAVGESQSTNN